MDPSMAAAGRSRLQRSRLGSVPGGIGDPLGPGPVDRPFSLPGFMSRRKDEVRLRARPPMTSLGLRGHARRCRGTRTDLWRRSDETGNESRRRVIRRDRGSVVRQRSQIWQWPNGDVTQWGNSTWDS